VQIQERNSNENNASNSGGIEQQLQVAIRRGSEGKLNSSCMHGFREAQSLVQMCEKNGTSISMAAIDNSHRDSPRWCCVLFSLSALASGDGGLCRGCVMCIVG